MSENDTNEPDGGADVPQAHPDLSSYSAEQLQQLLRSELLRRNSEGQPTLGKSPVTGRFTRRDGLAGWLESLWRRQPLYGRGSIEADASTVTFHGWQRTWLGVPAERALLTAAGRVRNVARIGSSLYLEIRRRGWFARRVTFEPDAGADVNGLLALLPSVRTRTFTAKRQDLLLFEREMRANCPVAWVTPVLVLLNVAAFVALVMQTGVFMGLGYQPMTFGFGNVPSLVLGGQWWRLGTALFVHADVLHLSLNMWALWSVGRLTERLFGNSRYLCIYLLAGVFAGLVTIAWDPEHWSIGASGAIFGVFGAFFAHLVHPATKVPRAIMRAHWVPTLLFVAFNLLAGAMQQGIDNAAHVGGLLAGFALGIAFIRGTGIARPLATWPARFAAVALLVGGTATAMSLGGVWRRKQPVAEQFVSDHSWYASGEARNLLDWQRLAAQSGAGLISAAQLAEGFAQDILPFWELSSMRLLGAVPGETDEVRRYRLAIAEQAALRFDWVKSIIDAANGDSGAERRIAELISEFAKQLARIERLALISRIENSGSGLARRQPFAMLRTSFSADVTECVRSPYVNVIKVAETDSPTDAPYLMDATACKAQALFIASEYEGLEDLFEAAGTDANVAGYFPMASLRAGLMNFFRFGPHSVETNLARLVEWRRLVPTSTLVGPLEAELFSAWAWQVRGTGFAREISQQAWELYGYRTEMALASLDAEAGAPQTILSPLWYQAWLEISIDDAHDRAALFAVFARAQALYPDYYPLHRAVLRSLMPRWGGSQAEVMAFIDEQVRQAPEAEQDVRYARLIWIYADLEGDELNVFQNIGAARWDRFHRGLTKLQERYTDSDYVLNALARFSCLAGYQWDYWNVRPQLESRKSATAWTMETTLESCDQRLPRPIE